MAAAGEQGRAQGRQNQSCCRVSRCRGAASPLLGRRQSGEGQGRGRRVPVLSCKNQLSEPGLRHPGKGRDGAEHLQQRGAASQCGCGLALVVWEGRSGRYSRCLVKSCPQNVAAAL